MKSIQILLVAILFSTPLFAQKEINAKAKIKSATVFLVGAEINNQFSASLPVGASTIIVQGIPNEINAATLQIGSEPGVTIQSTEFRLNYLNNQTKTPRQKGLEDTLEMLTNDLSGLNNSVAVIDGQENIFANNLKVGGANNGLSVVELQKMMDYYVVKSAALKADKLTLNQKQKKLNERIARYQNQLNEEQTKTNQPNAEVVVQVLTKAASQANFNLTYTVNTAGWNPIYDIRCENIKSPIKLNYKAQVWQNTGMNWDKVKLTISTGNPNESGTNPVLQPWYLNFIQTYNYDVYKKNRGTYSLNQTMAPAMAGNVMKAEADDVADKKVRMDGSLNEFTTMTESQLNATFDIDLLYDIPSDGKTHLVNMVDYELPATYEYYAVPKMDKDAFLLARITDWEKLNLLPAPANIFFENNYVGQSDINPNNTRDTLSLSLGRDKKIIIKRQKVTAFCSSKFIGVNKKEIITFDITVRNTKKDAIKLNLLDQFPVPQDKDIEVEVTESTGAVTDKEKGQLTWKLNLASQETKVLRLSYTVKYPKDKNIGTLN